MNTPDNITALLDCREAFEDELLDTIIETGSVHAADEVADRIDRLDERLHAEMVDAYFTGELA